MPTDSLPEPLKTFHDTGFEEIEHTADCALHIFGKNFLKLLTNAALGMTSLMAFEPSAIADDTTRHVELEAMDAESLLVEWLSELAYWAEMEMLVFHRFELCNVTPNHLQAVIHDGHDFTIRWYYKVPYKIFHKIVDNRVKYVYYTDNANVNASKNIAKRFGNVELKSLTAFREMKPFLF